jgi:hypothetical protein
MLPSLAACTDTGITGGVVALGFGLVHHPIRSQAATRTQSTMRTEMIQCSRTRAINRALRLRALAFLLGARLSCSDTGSAKDFPLRLG